MPTSRLVLSSLLVAAPLAAQTTWVVDAQNGPGTDYLDLAPAIAASSVGDVIVLRHDPSTVYAAATFTHGLTILGVGGKAQLGGNLFIQQLPADQHVVLRNLRTAPLDVSSPVGGYSRISATGCLGSVHLQDVVFDTPPFSPSGTCQWSFYDCRLVTMVGCYYRPVQNVYQGLLWQDCELVSTQDCEFHNLGGGYPPIVANRSRIVSVGTAWIGPYPWLLGTPGLPALRLVDSTLELAGDSMLTSGPGVAVVFEGTSSVFHGPSATVTQLAQAPTAATITTMGAFIDDASTMTVEVHGEPLGIGVLSYGEPTPAPVPLWGETYWLDLPTVNVFDFVLLDADGAASWSAPLPPSLPAGLSLWLQSAVFDATAGFRLTTPAVVTTP